MPGSAHRRPERAVHVVATDFGRQRARLWSSEATPDTKVAFAVRASSSIPFFFQAVVEGENRLVDGGILSNLPTFVFAREQQQSGKRILTFRLQGEPSPAADWSMHARAPSPTPGGITSSRTSLICAVWFGSSVPAESSISAAEKDCGSTTTRVAQRPSH